MTDKLLNCVVIGAGGAIGGAFVQRFLADPRVGAVHAFSRAPTGASHARLSEGRIDLEDEASIAAAIAAAATGGPIDRLIIATGTLDATGQGPEKSLRDIDAAGLQRYFAVNTIGPALAIKHAVPHLPRERVAIIAALSARVGSISDNRLGGWYGYRASKAALNMVVRTAAIEAQRRRPLSIIVGLHPGTVDSRLSRPFQANVPPDHLLHPADSVERLHHVLDRLQPQDSGRLFAYDGEEIAP